MSRSYTRKAQRVDALRIDTGTTRMDIEAFCAEHGVRLADVNIGTTNGVRNTDDMFWIVIMGVEFDHGDWIVFPKVEADAPWTERPPMARVEDDRFNDEYEARA